MSTFLIRSATFIIIIIIIIIKLYITFKNLYLFKIPDYY